VSPVLSAVDTLRRATPRPAGREWTER